MPKSAPDKPAQRGAALILLTLMVSTVLIPIVGLAIDGTILFLVKTKLSAAVDAAALAGARSLNIGLDLPSQTASAQSTIQSFYVANFPGGFWGTTNSTLTSSITQTGYKIRIVDVNAYVDSPLYFMRILGQTSSRILAHGQATRRDVNVIMVLDRSGSMAQAGVCGTMVAAARSFVDKFTNGRDRLGLITFMGSSNVDYAPSLNFKSASPSLDSVLSGLNCGGFTGSAEGLWQGYQQLVNINEPGALNLIVFFTDGRPNGITADFPVKTAKDTRYDSFATSSLVLMPPSNCTSSATKLGFIARIDPTATGYTFGVGNHQSGPISDTSQNPISAGGCIFPSDGWEVREDIAFIPLTDHWGNFTSGYKAVDTYPSAPYAGKFRVDTPTAISGASTNAADNAAYRIRQNASLNPVIYSIGLGGTSTEPIDDDLLRRIANDRLSPIYDSTKPAGFYVYSPTAVQLDDAFTKVAGEILRLSQ
ncbi:MAG: VWA domain-containing protein [Acidobacteriota bacterium]|nr:VWA domain-containing protein [Acidobacteriota bacterium]